MENLTGLKVTLNYIENNYRATRVMLMAAPLSIDQIYDIAHVALKEKAQRSDISISQISVVHL